MQSKLYLWQTFSSFCRSIERARYPRERPVPSTTPSTATISVFMVIGAGAYLPWDKTGQEPWAPIGGGRQHVCSSCFPSWEAIRVHIPSQLDQSGDFAPAVAANAYLLPLLSELGSNGIACCLGVHSLEYFTSSAAVSGRWLPPLPQSDITQGHHATLFLPGVSQHPGMPQGR